MWITIAFSYNTKIPRDDEVINGIAGLRHIEIGFLKPLLIIGDLLKRKVVLPLPCFALETSHNNFERVKHKWDDYFDLSMFNVIDKNPPFVFDNKGRPTEYNNKTIEYYNTDVNINELNNNIDIIVLSSYTDITRNKYSSSHIPIPINYRELLLSKRFNVSSYIKTLTDEILLKNKIIDYTFIHIRRGDFLYNKVLAPPFGTHTYTSPEYISKFIKKINFNIGNIIIIATNEKSIEYKNNIKKLIPYKTIIYEENLIDDILVNTIINDNYMKYQIMDEIAKRSKVNIITTELKLGDWFNYSLANNILQQPSTIKPKSKKIFSEFTFYTLGHVNIQRSKTFKMKFNS